MTQPALLAPSTPISAIGRTVLLYDGDCGLCQRSVRWLLRHDRRGRLLFAPQTHPAATALFARHGLRPEQLNSVVLVESFATPAERISLFSDAILNALSALGGLYRVAALLPRLVPVRFRNRLYAWVARNRRRLFPPPDSCSLPSPAERTHFLPS